MFNRKHKRVYDDDDGHVIADMNVEGMPWYRKKDPEEKKSGRSPSDLSKEETRWAILGTLKAALLVAGVFLGAFLLVIVLLCLHVWL